MKLSPRSFVIEWELHAWSGVLASLLLLPVFFFGAFSLFHGPLEVWERPELHAARGAPGSLSAAFELARQGRAVPAGGRVAVRLNPGTRFIRVEALDADWALAWAVWVDVESRTVIDGRHGLADALYRLHFFDFFTGGTQLAGLIAVMLLVATVSGLLIQLRNLWRERWQLRVSQRLRVWSGDLHKVLGVFTLPFVVVLGWSGAVLCLAGLVGQLVISTAFHGDEARARALYRGATTERALTNVPAAMLELDVLERAAHADVGDGRLRQLDVRPWGDSSAVARVTYEGAPLQGSRVVFLDAVSAAVLHTSHAAPTPSQRLENVLFGLHFVNFGLPLLPWLYAVLSLAVCVVVVTGNLVWLERRDAQRARRSSRWLERLTTGFAVAMPVSASAAFAVSALRGSQPGAMAVLLASIVVVVVSSLVRRFTARWFAIAAVLFMVAAVGRLSLSSVGVVSALLACGCAWVARRLFLQEKL